MPKAGTTCIPVEMRHGLHALQVEMQHGQLDMPCATQ